jgi:hypothetical protein
MNTLYFKGIIYLLKSCQSRFYKQQAALSSLNNLKWAVNIIFSPLAVLDKEWFWCVDAVFCLLKIVSHVCILMGCDQGGMFRDSKREGWGSHHASWAVDLQHGTGLEGNSHLCIKGHPPPQGRGFCIGRPKCLNHCILYNTVLILYIFLLC